MRPLPPSATFDRRFAMTRPLYWDLRLPLKGYRTSFILLCKRIERGLRGLVLGVVNKFRLASLNISSAVGRGRARGYDGALWPVKILPLRVIGALNAAPFSRLPVNFSYLLKLYYYKCLPTRM